MAMQGEDTSKMLEMEKLVSCLSALFEANAECKHDLYIVPLSNKLSALIINKETADQLTHMDEYERQAKNIIVLIREYIGYQKRELLCNALKDLLYNHTIEVTTDAQGHLIINILKNNMQASFLRLLIQHMTPQKQEQLQSSQGFNRLKHLLLAHLRHKSSPINVNSMSVTLRRAVMGK